MMLNVIKVILVLTALILGASGQDRQPDSLSTRDDAITIASSNRRYAVRFSDGRSEGNQSGKLWGTITVRDLHTHKERTVRVAEGDRGEGIFEGFSIYEGPDAWSPDGLYLVYWDDYCMNEPAVPGGVVCHLHEIRFLSMKPSPLCREELVLSRYAFGGWYRGRAHTVLEILINEVGQKVKRLPCARRR
jgi:hypothetical protein